MPISLYIENSIDEEISEMINPIYAFDRNTYRIDSIQDFSNILDLIFKSKAFTTVISGLMKVASKDIPK